jgi:murein DD-endopeptidase MepM/ murein hydrolase activator NlpD
VAKANQITNPDRIHPGQRLDLSMLGTPGTLPARPHAITGQEIPKPWQSLVEGAVALSSPFGLRKDPFTGRVQQHNGIDVSAPFGSPVSAFEPGTVTFSGWKPGYGNIVIIRHEDGLESIYAHLSRSLVAVGQAVESRIHIACVGSSGRSTGPHLYFEVRRNGKAIDPMSQIGLPKPGL